MGRLESRPSWGKIARPYLKNTKVKRTGGVAKVEEHLPSKCKSLSSNPSTAKKNQKNL
jgi:hypothetical protein